MPQTSRSAFKLDLSSTVVQSTAISLLFYFRYLLTGLPTSALIRQNTVYFLCSSENNPFELEIRSYHFPAQKTLMPKENKIAPCTGSLLTQNQWQSHFTGLRGLHALAPASPLASPPCSLHSSLAVPETHQVCSGRRTSVLLFPLLGLLFLQIFVSSPPLFFQVCTLMLSEWPSLSTL